MVRIFKASGSDYFLNVTYQAMQNHPKNHRPAMELNCYFFRVGQYSKQGDHIWTALVRKELSYINYCAKLNWTIQFFT